MSSASGARWVVEGRDGRRVQVLSPFWLLVRVAVVAPVGVVTFLIRHADPAAQLWPGIVLAVLALFAADVADSDLGLVVLGGTVVWWGVALSDAGLVAAVVVAGCLLVQHLALAAAAAPPPDAAPERGVVLRLAARGAVVWAVGAVPALAALAVAGRFEAGALLVAVALLVVAGSAWATARLVDAS